MKTKLLLSLALTFGAMCLSQAKAAQTTETFTLTGMPSSNWSEGQAPTHTLAQSPKACVKGTGGHLFIWAGSTGSSGVSYSGTGYMVFAGVDNGDVVTFTLTDPNDFTDLPEIANTTRTTSEENNTVSYTINSSEVGNLQFTISSSITITKIEYTHEAYPTYDASLTYNLLDRNNSDWTKGTAISIGSTSVDAIVNNTNNHFYIWGFQTAASGVSAAKDAKFAFANVKNGDVVRIRTLEPITEANFPLYENSDKITHTVDGHVHTFTVNDESVTALMFKTTGKVFITEIIYSPSITSEDLTANGTAAKNTIDGLVFGSTSKTTLKGAIDTELAKDQSTLANRVAINTAIDGIVATAQSLVSPYALANSAVTNMAAVKDVAYSESITGAHNIYETAVSTAQSDLDAATTTDGIGTIVSTLRSALITYISNAQPTGGACFDLTVLISNPSFANNNADGWTVSGKIQFQSYGNAEFFQTNFDINQSLGSMPAGNYRLNVKAFNRPGAYASLTGSETVTAQIYINNGATTIKHICHDAQSTKVNKGGSEVKYGSTDLYIPDNMHAAAVYFGEGYYENSVLYNLAEAGDLNFGFREGSSSSAYWTIFDDFRLYYYGNAVDVSLNETDGFSAVSDIAHANVTVSKNMTANVWNTFVVPFDMAIPSGWTVKEPIAFDGGTLTFGNASSIEAGKPYIVMPTEAVTSFSATGVTLKKDLSNTTVGTGTTVTMTGTYSKIDAIDYSTQVSYVIGIKNGVSALYKVNSTVSLKPFRAYFTVEGGENVKANVINLNFDGESTSIREIVNGKSSNGKCYDLSGRRVAQPQRGLYIVNGKKFIVK